MTILGPSLDWRKLATQFRTHQASGRRIQHRPNEAGLCAAPHFRSQPQLQSEPVGPPFALARPRWLSLPMVKVTEPKARPFSRRRSSPQASTCRASSSRLYMSFNGPFLQSPVSKSTSLKKFLPLSVIAWAGPSARTVSPPRNQISPHLSPWRGTSSNSPGVHWNSTAKAPHASRNRPAASMACRHSAAETAMGFWHCSRAQASR